MKDLGLILIGSCGLSSTPHTPRKARRFTWDIVADLGIPRTLEVLKGNPVVYLSSLTQSNLEITKLVTPVDNDPFKYDIRIDERFHNCTINDVNEIFSLIRSYASDPSTEFNVPLERIENMLTNVMNVSNIVVAEASDGNTGERFHVFSDIELKAALPKDKYEKITDPDFEDTAIMHNHTPYIIAMSTKYTESENMWFLRKYASTMPSDRVEQLIGTMLEITNQSMILGKDRTEGPTVAVVLDYGRPFGERLVNVHARDKSFPSKAVCDIMNSKIKPGNFTVEGKGKYRLLFVTIDTNLSLPDPTSYMKFDIHILDLLRPPFSDDLSLTEQRRILELIEKNTVGLREG